jgi:hypothetical protein
VEQYRLGLETDRLSVILYYGMALSMHEARQHREAIECARKTLEIDATPAKCGSRWGSPNFTQASHRKRLEPQNALWSWHTGTIGMRIRWPRPTIWLAMAGAARNGRGSSPTRAVAPSGLRWITPPAMGGAMFEALDRACRQRDFFLPQIQNLRFFDPYRTNPRYHTLVQRMNLA